MLRDVWRWAGKFTTSERNIGISHWEISVALRIPLLDDTRVWIEYTNYPPDEIAVRFHHQLVQIRPFPNGNGRYSRLMAESPGAKTGCGRGRGGLRRASRRTKTRTTAGPSTSLTGKQSVGRPSFPRPVKPALFLSVLWGG
jgi:hypothetical protein